LSEQAGTTNSGPRLRRTLTLWNLIVIGIVIIQPIAPMGIYGVINNAAGGHVVTTILIALVAMFFTAISYGKMARVYPSAGSAYTYVGQEIHAGLGYLTGWAMVMDYILNPLICTIICSKLTQNILPEIPYWTLAIFYAVFFSVLNLGGVKTSARINEVLAAGMTVVVVVFFAFVIRFVLGYHQRGPGFFTEPFYNPATFNLSAIGRGTSLAVLTYIGFDGISTFSEEVENPRRNIMLATVLVCVVAGILSAAEVYAAQLVWGSKPFPADKVESAFPIVAQQIGGFFLFHLLNHGPQRRHSQRFLRQD
jgi:putrescine importer